MIFRVDFEPLGRRISCAEGATILEAARDAGIPLSAVCGGRQSCRRCQVRVVAGRTSEPGAGERARLDAEELAAGYRLACAARVLGDLAVDVPAGSLAGVQRVQVAGGEPEPVPDPVVAVCELGPPGPAGDGPADRWESLRRRLGTRCGLPSLRIDADLAGGSPPVPRAGGLPALALIREDELIGVLPPGREPLGLAVDLGTSTIAAYLLDLRTGRILATRGAMNPQIERGEDVISRLRCAMEGGGEALRRSALEALNRLVGELAADPGQVAEVTIAGNTAMHHLLLGLPVRQLGLAPYRPAVHGPLDIKARDLGLQAARGAYVHFLPNIAGFVGGDHVAMLLATGIWNTDRTVIGIDIGTNTEVTLAANGGLTSLSCASGPAFEGAGLSHGMRAADGAVEQVGIDAGGVHLRVVGGGPPAGICGSGIIALLGALQRRKILGPRGDLRDHPRVRRAPQGGEFVLASREETGTGREVVVTRRDIGEIQLAKAAIRAGIQVLLDDARIGEREIDEVIIAGGFGQHLDPGSAVDIGLFPPLPPEKFRQVGNAAGTGAGLVLASRRERATAAEIAKRVRYIELTAHPGFSRRFARALRFADG